MKSTDIRYIGVEIGGTKLQVVLGNNEARILERFRMNVEKEKGAAGIREKLTEPLKDLARMYQPAAVGIGFGGPVDFRHGKVAVSHHIDGWDGFELVKWVRDLTGIPCIMDNDANVAALGEAIIGAGKDYDKVFYVTLGSGVGGGMVNGGNIYHGALPGESEIGLMIYDRKGKNIESMCSGWSMDARIRSYVSENPDSILAGLISDSPGTAPEARFLAQAISMDDKGASGLLDETADILGWGLSHVVHLFHPQIIILGGGLSLMGDILVEKVSASMKKYITRAFQPGPDLKSAALKEDVVGVGALLLAIQSTKK